jgi:asparagine synthase (glutamine-hydrolysing)
MRTLLDRKDRLSMATGLEVRVPFCDHRLQDYVFNAPMAMKVGPRGAWKHLLREAVRDLLPGSVLDRPKTGYPVSNDEGYDQYVQQELTKRLTTGTPQLEPLLNPVVVRDVRRDPTAVARLTRTEIDLALHLDEWLSTYGLTLEL